MARLTAQASFFKNRFVGSIFYNKFSKIKDNVKLEVYVVPPSKAKTIEQNNTFWALVDAIYNSGQTSFDSIESLRRYFMERSGLIEYEDPEIDNDVKEIINLTSKLIQDDNIRNKYLKIVNRKNIKYTSLSVASSNKLSSMIDDVIKYYLELPSSIKKVEEILDGLDNN